MANFVKLTHRNGEPIWVNPMQVISVAPVFKGEFPRQQNAELRGVLAAADRGQRVVVELLIDSGHAAGLGAGASAAPDDHVDLSGIDLHEDQRV